VTSDVLRVANCSGFFGDRLSAAHEMVAGGPIDVLTGDYLAELTMAILMRQRMRDPATGYARTFLTQMEDVLADCVERGIKVVANAGGLNPSGLATEVRELATRLGVSITVATVTGDDLMPRIGELSGELTNMATGERLQDRGLSLVTANAYLGGWGIAAALSRGADVVVTGRVTDAALVVGPSAWRFGWERDDWDALAGAVVAGHVVECGAQATGGNYSFFAEVPGMDRPGFPIAEVHPDGSSVITKHPGTGGLVSVGTVTAQLLYEIGPPGYLTPDVVARIDTVELHQDGPDRVTIDGVRGEPPPPTTKVAGTALAGFRNSFTFVLAGLDIEAKAAVVESALWAELGGKDRFAAVDVQLLRTDQVNPVSNEAAFAHLKVTVMDPDRLKVGRQFSNAAVGLALANYPGFTMTAPPGRETPNVVYWPALVAQPPSFVTADGETVEVPPTVAQRSETAVQPGRLPDGAASAPAGDGVVVAPIGRVVGARSGDKGGDANLGVWARNDAAYAWLDGFLTTERLRELLPEARTLTVERYRLPNLRAINFVLVGFLGEGVASSSKLDPQAKSLGEYFRAKLVPIPEGLLAY
jgi:hypothetical protein